MEPFYLLNKKIQKVIHEMKWENFRPIQDEAILHMVNNPSDMIISAPTASGKTEAAFLPIISQIADKGKDSVKILYISPLKALINDQFSRIEALCKHIDFPITKWHGDANQSKKVSLIKNPAGILLITPESIESLFINKTEFLGSLFKSLEYIVIVLYHIYKLDNVDTISKLIGTKYVNNTLYDLYNGHIVYCKTDRPFFNISNFKIGDILDGYCPNIEKFISYTGFDYDLDQTIGIGHLPFKIESDQKFLTDEQVTDFILIYGGIRVDKTYVLKFDYSIDLSTIKMKYCLCKDSDNALYIIGYTESKEDISVSQLESSIKKYYDIAKQNDDKIKARLKKLVEAYDSYKEDVKNQHEKIL